MLRSRELLAREPKNAGYKRELAYAYSNLGSIARERGMASDALGHFNDSQAVLRQLLVDAQNDPALKFDLSEGLSWTDRKRVVRGKSVHAGVNLGGRHYIKKKK